MHRWLILLALVVIPTHRVSSVPRPVRLSAMAAPNIDLGRVVSYHIVLGTRRDAFVAAILPGGETPPLQLRWWNPLTNEVLLAEAPHCILAAVPDVDCWDWLDATDIAEAPDLEVGNSVAQFDLDNSYHEGTVTARTSAARPLVDLVEWRPENPIGQREVRLASVPHNEDVTPPAVRWRWINE